MPELPEVETTRRGIEQRIVGLRICKTIVRTPQLRWPIPENLATHLDNNTITQVQRRAKYLLLNTQTGTLIIHLGMSGCLKIQDSQQAPIKHDHVELVFSSKQCLRYHDPRRFGAILWTNDPPHTHPLLATLGVEPLHASFTPNYLHHIAKQRRCDIKQLIMNSKIVVGVGNIYANEALFVSAIRPTTPAYKLSLQRCKRLVEAIKAVLQHAINCGGTTLKDFHDTQGKPGYFTQELKVYGRNNEPCVSCGKPLKRIVQQQRTTIYCIHCQR